MRMLSLVLALLLIVPSTATLTTAQGADQADKQSKVIAMENAWNLAEEHKDVKALAMLLDNSLVYVDYDGTMMSKTDFLELVKSPAFNPEEEANERMEARLYGDTAVVTGIYRIKGTEKGKSFIRRGRFTDTWISRDGRWVCVASQYTLISK
jgi:ketosteroid isomerase-like protein